MLGVLELSHKTRFFPDNVIAIFEGSFKHQSPVLIGIQAQTIRERE